MPVKNRLTRVDAEGVPCLVQYIEWNSVDLSFYVRYYDGASLKLSALGSYGKTIRYEKTVAYTLRGHKFMVDSNRLWPEVYYDVEQEAINRYFQIRRTNAS